MMYVCALKLPPNINPAIEMDCHHRLIAGGIGWWVVLKIGVWEIGFVMTVLSLTWETPYLERHYLYWNGAQPTIVLGLLCHRHLHSVGGLRNSSLVFIFFYYSLRKLPRSICFFLPTIFSYWNRMISHFLHFIRHDDVMTWKFFLHYWPFVRGFMGNHWIPLTKCQKCRDFSVPLLEAWTSFLTNS